MDPLVKVTDTELGSNGTKLPYDHITPRCSLCARANTGVLTPTFLALRGHWALVAELGVEAFVIDSRLDVAFLELPSGKRKAIIVDLRFSQGAAVTVHEECAEKAVGKLGALRGIEDAWGDIDEGDTPEEEEVDASELKK